MITYKPDAKGQTITVYLGRKIAGRIIWTLAGYRYLPRGSSSLGEPYPTLEACKRSLEAA